MSILEKFFKNKKGLSGSQEKVEVQENPAKRERIVEVIHAKAILEDGKLYNTETAKKVFSDEEQNIAFCGSSIRRSYFVTAKGKWFSADERVDVYNKGEYPQEQTVVASTYDELRMENEMSVKKLLGKIDLELYKQYFGEVEEA